MSPRRKPARLRALAAVGLVLLAGALLLARGLGPGRASAPPSSPPSQGGTLLVAMLDVGQGDSVLIRGPQGRTALVDAGDSPEVVERVILPFLERLGVRRLDYVVATHPHQDHVGGMATLMERMPTETFVDSAQPGATNQAYARALRLVHDNSIKALRARYPTTHLDLGPGVTARVLAPEEPLLKIGASMENNNSVVIRLQFGGVAALLMSDAEQEAELRLLSHKADVRSQILKVGHHGSRSSTTEDFLRAVRPQVALISAGKGNEFGHPHSETLSALKRHGARVFRTDENGMVQVETDGQTLRVRADR